MKLVAREANWRRDAGERIHGLAFFDIPAIETAIDTGRSSIAFASVDGEPSRASASGWSAPSPRCLTGIRL